MKNLITVNGGTIGFVKKIDGVWVANKTAHFRKDETLAVGKTKKVATERFIERYFA